MILIYRIKERFGIDAELVSGKVIYKETITEPVIGIGHYEPLRHYAEVRLLLEPLPEGAGLVFESAVSEDDLDRNWQRLIMKHLLERQEPPGMFPRDGDTDRNFFLLSLATLFSPVLEFSL